jgi:hypothetical protein
MQCLPYTAPRSCEFGSEQRQRIDPDERRDTTMMNGMSATAHEGIALRAIGEHLRHG